MTPRRSWAYGRHRTFADRGVGMMPDELPLSQFLLQLTQSSIDQQSAYYQALTQLSEENRAIVENNDLAAAQRVIERETGSKDIYFWIIRWII